MKDKNSRGSNGGIRKWAPAAMLAAAIALLAGGTVGNVRAALTYYSDNYDLDVNVPSIGVTLEENGAAVAWRNYRQDNTEDTGSQPLLSWAAADGKQFQPGKQYTEELSVYNSGSVDSYVKVELFRYWTDASGKKITTLSPGQIHLDMGTTPGWYIDYDASTEERTVLYYALPLAPGERSSLLSSQVMMDNGVKSHVKETTVKEDENGRTFEVSYAYDGVRMYLEAEVYAVQAHNAQAAIKSAWGKSVNVDSAGALQFTSGSGGNGGSMWDSGNGTGGTVNPGTSSGTGAGSTGSGSGSVAGSGSGTGSGSGSTGGNTGGTSTGSGRYALNTNSMKIHVSSCPWVPKINQTNKKWTNETYESLVEQGYKPCEDCNPGGK